MQLSELSRESGLPIATIKYYVREGLLPPGDGIESGRAEYGGRHLRRLRLIRALVQVGDLSLASVRQIVAAVEDDGVSMHEALGVAHYALAARTASNAGSDQLVETRVEIDAFLDDLGWTLKPDAPDRDELASMLLTLRTLGWSVDAAVFARYAEAADRIAAWELSRMPEGIGRETAVENAVIGTVVFDAALSALRRLAEEHHSAERARGG